MRKTTISVFMALVMIGGCVGCNAGNNDGAKNNVKEETASQKLEILKSDLKLTQEQTMSKIKAEYLKQNEGYKKDDAVVAIVSLKSDAVIDAYLNGGSNASSVGDYAASAAGKAHAARISSEQNALVALMQRNGYITGVENRYSTVMNGVAVNTTYGKLSEIEKLSGVESVILSDTFNRPLTAAGTDSASSITNAVDVYETGIFKSDSVSFTGKKTAVAVLDSGFDCSHSVFNRTLNTDELWLTQQDISAKLSQTNAVKTTSGLELADVWYSNKIPFVYDYADKDNDVFPYDSEHGTHVAGIIGGKDNVITGVAVDTQLVLMKVFPDLDDGAKTDDILAALEDAVVLGVDVINMSLGSSCGFSREEDGNKINDVYDKINESGVSLITAASNSYSSAFGGEQGNTNKVTNPDSSTVGSPSTYTTALSVASISGVKSSYLVANGSQVVFYHESSSISGDENDFVNELDQQPGLGETGTREFEYVTVPGYGDRANYLSVDVKGKIALVRRGSTTFEDKALRAKNAGAVACIIYNNVEGDISMSMGKSDHIPTISISKELGTMLASRETGTIVVSKANKAGPFMSDFSSWGPSPNLELKPEITAHGGKIKSAIPGGDYDELSGTSMATPNLCGIVVLIRQYLKEKFPTYSQKEIVVLANQMMMSTATIVLNEEGNPYSPRKQGAGLASLFNVVNTRAYLSVDGIDRTKLELKDDPKKTGKYVMSFNVVNISDAEAQYNLSLVGMTETVSTSDSDYVAEKGQLLNGKHSVKVEGQGSYRNNVVTVKANSTVKVTVTYNLSSADKKLIDSLFPNGMYVEGFVKLTAVKEGDIDLNVPFLAFYGDWTRAPIFDKTYYEVETEAHDGSIDEEDKLKADYFATTPYGSYFYNYIIPLGTYLYDIDPDYDYIPATEEHIAISSDLATIDGFSSVYGGLLRNAKTMTYTITDKLTGEVVKEFIDYNANKAYSLGGTPIPYFEYLNWKSRDMSFINNREYEFKMSAVLDYGDGGANTNLRNTFAFDFCFDNEAPVLKECVYEKVYDRTLKKDRYYLNMTIYDNHYAQSITPLLFTSSSSYTVLTNNPIPIYSEKGKDNKVRIEITDFLDDIYYDAILTSALGFSIDDYALNSNIFLCQLPGTRGDFKFTRNGETDGSDLVILTIDEGEVVDLTAYLATSDKTVDADKDYLKHLVWESSNEDIAVVERGQVRGISAGRSTISVTEQMELRRATILINVRERKNAAANTAAEKQVDGTKTERTAAPLSANHVPDVTDPSVTLDSLRFAYFETTFAYSRAAQRSEIGSTGSKIFVSSLGSRVSMYPGERIKLAYDLQPWYLADRYTLRYASSNPQVASVDPKTGDVTALRRGAATITLRIYDKDANFDDPDNQPVPVSNLLASLAITVNSEFVIENRTLIAYKGYGDENGVVNIPNDEGILYIGPFAFCLYDTDNTIENPEDDMDKNKIPSTNTSIKRVIVPNGVEDIQKYAFYNCPGLEAVELPDSVKYIREYAFYGDEKLSSINLDKVTVVGRYAFYNCKKLNDIDLTKAFAVGDSAFRNCIELAYVDLSALRNTGANAFAGCTALKSVKFDENGHTKLSERMFAESGLKSVTLYEKLEIPTFAFARCKELTEVIVQNGLVTVGYGAFCECDKLETVTFKSSVSVLDEQAFFDCGELKEVTLPDCEVSLSSFAFRECGKLATVKLGAHTVLKDVRGSVFLGTQLQTFAVVAENGHYSVSDDGHLLLNKAGDKIVLAATKVSYGDYALDARYTTVGAGAFSGTDIRSLTISNAQTVIEDYAFAECVSLESLTLPASGIGKIGNHAFDMGRASGDELKKPRLGTVTNLQGVKEVGDYAFASTNLKTVSVGADAIYGEGAFFRSALVTVSIGKNTAFGLGAFQNCASLERVNMPEEGGVHFGVACFSNDTSLVTIDLSKHDEKIESEAFYNCQKLRGTNGTVINLANVTEVGDHAFADCSSITAVIMPKVEKIGESAFGRYSQSGSAPVIQAINLPETLVSLGDGAFLGCEYLEEITIPSSLDKISDFAFAFCLRLNRVTLPSSVTKIGTYSFAGCESLTDINLGSVREFADRAFNSAVELRNIDLAAAETIGFGSFADTAVSGNIVANQLIEVGDYAFQGANLNSFTAGKLVRIGIAAFQNNRNLTEFTFTKDLEKVGTIAFNGCTRLTGFYFEDGGKKAEGDINGYAKLYGGALYTRMKNGSWMLASVPGGKTDWATTADAANPAIQVKTFEVMEGATAIEFYAGNANTSVEKIVLPDSLKSVGNYAFYGYNGLKTVEFKSYTAPALENSFVEDAELAEDDPGFELLHNQFNLFKTELYYYTFIDLVGKKDPIEMILPANASIQGYDSVVYQAYFGTVEDARRSGYTAKEEALVKFVDYAKEIAKLDTVTFADEQLINNAIGALNAVKQDATKFGYTKAEWNDLVQKVQNAKAQLDALNGVAPPAAESGFPVWAIVLIVIAGVLVAAGVTVTVLIFVKKNQGGRA